MNLLCYSWSTGSRAKYIITVTYLLIFSFSFVCTAEACISPFGHNLAWGIHVKLIDTQDPRSHIQSLLRRIESSLSLSSCKYSLYSIFYKGDSALGHFNT